MCEPSNNANSNQSITCLFSNAQSVLNKLQELQAIVYQHSPQIIGIAESWCNSDVGDAELHLQEYNLFRDDRKSGIGGGVMLYIHEGLLAVPCKVLNDVGFDNSLWYTISLTDNDKLLVEYCIGLHLHPLTTIKNYCQSSVTFMKHLFLTC